MATPYQVFVKLLTSQPNFQLLHVIREASQLQWSLFARKQRRLIVLEDKSVATLFHMDKTRLFWFC